MLESIKIVSLVKIYSIIFQVLLDWNYKWVFLHTNFDRKKTCLIVMMNNLPLTMNSFMNFFSSVSSVCGGFSKWCVLNNFFSQNGIFQSILFFHIFPPSYVLFIFLFLQAQFLILVQHAPQWVLIFWCNMMRAILGFHFMWILSFLTCFPIPLSVLKFNAQQHHQLFRDTTFRRITGESQ